METCIECGEPIAGHVNETKSGPMDDCCYDDMIDETFDVDETDDVENIIRDEMEARNDPEWKM
jgi:hypothetical protein